MRVRVYQIDPEKDTNKVINLSLSETNEKGGVDASKYICVYDGEVDRVTDLEHIESAVKQKTEEQYGRSASRYIEASDVVEISGDIPEAYGRITYFETDETILYADKTDYESALSKEREYSDFSCSGEIVEDKHVKCFGEGFYFCDHNGWKSIEFEASESSKFDVKKNIALNACAIIKNEYLRCPLCSQLAQTPLPSKEAYRAELSKSNFDVRLTPTTDTSSKKPSFLSKIFSRDKSKKEWTELDKINTPNGEKILSISKSNLQDVWQIDCFEKDGQSKKIVFYDKSEALKSYKDGFMFYKSENLLKSTNFGSQSKSDVERWIADFGQNPLTKQESKYLAEAKNYLQSMDNALIGAGERLASISSEMSATALRQSLINSAMDVPSEQAPSLDGAANASVFMEHQNFSANLQNFVAQMPPSPKAQNTTNKEAFLE